jgi:hypothetical protein
MPENEHEWEKEEVEVERPISPVVSARLTIDLADRLFELASRKGVPMSALVREALEDYLSGAGYTPANFDITVSSPDVPVTLYTGRSNVVSTTSQPAMLELTEP